MLRKLKTNKVTLFSVLTLTALVLTLSGCGVEPRERGPIQEFGFAEGEVAV